eukprot:gnl/MRDRNA2_/MRDRNA2_65944_c0_seq2.p1 gnl/MRDRNA2_/MRDRNA2_65944_c0~~gnl/MRDRNA2_/MRDRNA2_65944_c0_seq2.p1  ORF type:complete len:216 (-),score=44.51 gnl/MRDRNA2_/MRDRNA2_65944_c0_seq2:64-711(-)
MQSNCGMLPQVLVITHGGFIKEVMNLVQGGPPWAPNASKNTAVYVIRVKRLVDNGVSKKIGENGSPELGKLVEKGSPEEIAENASPDLGKNIFMPGWSFSVLVKNDDSHLVQASRVPSRRPSTPAARGNRSPRQSMPETSRSSQKNAATSSSALASPTAYARTRRSASLQVAPVNKVTIGADDFKEVVAQTAGKTYATGSRVRPKQVSRKHQTPS